MDEFGPDGTQALPPPPSFPDPLAGLVTGEGPPHREVVTPVEPARPVAPPVVAVPAPVQRGPARRRQVPRPDPPAPTLHAALPAEPKKGRGALVGCLVVLLVVSGLLVNVLREIIGAVADLLR
ncbi:hypothetical protein [Saccharothrix xinjiangensis]|uniref:Uncharacterized protein n=1 Tax=Saccharothrix xinjiangensis TaxID=204798 RepID=A0ABV9XYX2_9PSEU